MDQIFIEKNHNISARSQITKWLHDEYLSKKALGLNHSFRSLYPTDYHYYKSLADQQDREIKQFHKYISEILNENKQYKFLIYKYKMDQIDSVKPIRIKIAHYINKLSQIHSKDTFHLYLNEIYDQYFIEETEKDDNESENEDSDHEIFCDTKSIDKCKILIKEDLAKTTVSNYHMFSDKGQRLRYERDLHFSNQVLGIKDDFRDRFPTDKEFFQQLTEIDDLQKKEYWDKQPFGAKEEYEKRINDILDGKLPPTPNNIPCDCKISVKIISSLCDNCKSQGRPVKKIDYHDYIKF